MIASTFKTESGSLRIVCGYFPNGSEVGSEKFAYKLAWLKALNQWLKSQLQEYTQLALLGDFNIAPDDRDVWDPKGWEGNILVSDALKPKVKLVDIDKEPRKWPKPSDHTPYWIEI